MEIERIKIPNELMDELVKELFEIIAIGGSIRDRGELKATQSKTVLPIKPEIVEKFYVKWNDSFTNKITIPYISFISDNAHNELQVYITQCNADTKIVTISDVSLRTLQFYKHDNDKYFFTNQSSQNTSSMFYQRIDQTYEEKMAMYMKLPKEKIIEMLIECNKIIEAFNGKNPYENVSEKPKEISVPPPTEKLNLIPHTCPVCGGKGNVPRGFYNQSNFSTTIATPELCRSCYGTGIVWG